MSYVITTYAVSFIVLGMLALYRHGRLVRALRTEKASGKKKPPPEKGG